MPRETLTMDQIVRAAVDLLDRDGIDGLSMRKLGASLGSAATAMYWHVRNKDELLALATDHVWAAIELPSAPAGAWRSAVVQMATRLFATVTAHPWLITAMSAHLLYGHGKARYDDHLLGLFETAGLTTTEADLAAFAAVSGTLGAVLAASAEATWRHRLTQAGASGDPHRETVAHIEAVASSYPRLQARSMREVVDADPAAEHVASLDVVLDGIERRLFGR